MLKDAMQVVERVFARFQNTVTISKIQTGFVPGKGAVDAILAVRLRVKLKLRETMQGISKKYCILSSWT